MGSVRKIEAGG
jgi:hypothetical protein